MFERSGVDHTAVRGWVVDLGCAELTSDDGAMIDEIRALEELVCAAQARQSRLAAAFDHAQRATLAARGVPAERQGRGIAEQVALARRESPHRGRQHLGLAKVLGSELPLTRAAFDAGRITEWRATVIARETACLSLEDRRAVDRAIAGDPDALESYSDRVVLGELRKLAARLDPAAVAERRRRAEAGRHVSIRPAPDTMAYLTVLLPVAQAVAVYAALSATADRDAATGDVRSRGQLMADTLVARVTGAPTIDGRPVPRVSLGLVMTDRTLLAGAPDTAHLDGCGAIPADLARELVADHLDTGSQAWLRRLFTDPATGELVAMDSRQRLFRGRLREAINLRDQFGRTPWCNSPIRHRDHVTGLATSGETAVPLGQGLCEQCNYAKQAPGWRARPRPSPNHAVETTTPTGHTYTSHAPPLVALRHPAFQQVDRGRWVLVG
jgi:hypothetical protein